MTGSFRRVRAGERLALRARGHALWTPSFAFSPLAGQAITFARQGKRRAISLCSTDRREWPLSQPGAALPPIPHAGPFRDHKGHPSSNAKDSRLKSCVVSLIGYTCRVRKPKRRKGGKYARSVFAEHSTPINRQAFRLFSHPQPLDLSPEPGPLPPIPDLPCVLCQICRKKLLETRLSHHMRLVHGA